MSFIHVYITQQSNEDYWQTYCFKPAHLCMLKHSNSCDYLHSGVVLHVKKTCTVPNDSLEVDLGVGTCLFQGSVTNSSDEILILHLLWQALYFSCMLETKTQTKE